MATRRVRAFKRWMNSNGIECSDALGIIDVPEEGIAVKALSSLKEGDVVAKIPKNACLTIKSSGAREIIESAGLDGLLGLAVAVMYERSLGQESPWAGYLQLLPEPECLPLVWTVNEVNELLCGTELHKTVQEDKALICEDWKEYILPLLDLAPFKLNPKHFGIDQYFSVKTLIASRAFESDDFHGFGMVPLVDLFNHKTGAEDVHLSSLSSHSKSDNDADANDNDVYIDNNDGEQLTPEVDNTASETAFSMKNCDGSDMESNLEDDQIMNTASETAFSMTNCDSCDMESNLRDDQTMLEMIMVKDVRSGAEVFNTYGTLSNAGLLHRYGFTEQDNPYDILNIDLDLVIRWSSSLFSGRYSRARLSLWRRLGYSACVSQRSEYFEISSDGESQIDLLVLLYIILLPEDAYHKMDLRVLTSEDMDGPRFMLLLENNDVSWTKTSEVSKESLLNRNVCDGLLSLADLRESFYGSRSMEDDIEELRRCSPIKDKKRYHSLMLRIGERKILEKLRTNAAVFTECIRIMKNSARKKLKRSRTKL